MISIYLFSYLPFRNLSRGKSLGGKRRFSPPGKLQDEGMDSVCKSIFKGKSNETSSGGSGGSTSSNGTTGSTLEEMGISFSENQQDDNEEEFGTIYDDIVETESSESENEDI